MNVLRSALIILLVLNGVIHVKSQDSWAISVSDLNGETQTHKDTLHDGVVVPVFKRTDLGLYVNAEEAFEMWKQAPKDVKILDVRTLEEYIFVGHPEMAYLVELVCQTHLWDSESKRFSVEANPDFLLLVEAIAEKDNVLLLMCRSGGRSAMAVNMLAANGYTNVYSIVDGMEGDKVSELESVFDGKHMKNGWKNAGLPWTYELNENQIPSITLKNIYHEKE